MSGVNDFVCKFATVNGSGSASANTMFAKTIFRMGVPVSPKNIFPSNIQGLPTWYEVRVSEKGYLARRDGIDLMVAMNPQTYREDLAEIVPGGWLLYDSTMPRQWPRDDIHVLPIPIAAMCAKRWADPRQRQLFKNMVYVGALSALLDLDMEVLKGVVADQLRGKEKLISANLDAVTLGREYALANFQCPLPIRVQKSDGARGKIMVTGNNAAALGAIYAGATVCSWYPITPSTSLAEAFEGYLKRLRTGEDGKVLGAVVQAEDELAAIGMAIGAGWNGACVHSNLRPWNFIDERVPGARLFRRNSRGAVQHPARRAVDRHADAYPAIGHSGLRVCLARRYQARSSVPIRSE